MKAIYMTSQKNQFQRVYPNYIREKIENLFEVKKGLFDKKSIEKNEKITADIDCIFTTWGMEHFTKDEIKKYFPKLKYVFYSAGSVQHFAKEFLESGVRVYSAFMANAVPVAEYTTAQILLSAKGYFQAEKKSKLNYYGASKFSDKCGGLYNTKVGIVGVGAIGSMVAENLKNFNVDVYYYDPFLSSEKAESLCIKSKTLEEIFTECDVITNHLANKECLEGVYNYRLFEKMKPYATFINTGRGKQVVEKDLIKALKKVKTRTALLDVTIKEPCTIFNRLRRMKNVFITPHIAGSNGREVERMAEYMLEDAKRLQKGEKARYEVTIEMLKTMA